MEQRFSDFCVPLAFLMSHDVIAKQYDELRSTFPACHFVLATVTASKKFAPPMSLSVDPAATLRPTSDMHMKQRMILSAFLSHVRTKSRHLLKHYAIVEPLGFWFKGYMQPSRKSISGMTNSDMRTVWTRIGKMHDRCILGFNQKLLLEARCHGAFDNHNKKKIKKTITDGKTAINHIGTSTFFKEDVPYQLPNGTTMTSPC